jgi:aryl sulfotransferase
VRLFLTAYNHPEQDEVDINAVDVSLHAGNRELFDRVIGLEASDLTPAEIERQLAEEAEEPLFIKVHDRWRRTPGGGSLFPPEITAATIYIVRDPRAVASSYANHYGISVDEAIDQMAMSDNTVFQSLGGLRSQLPQPRGSWSDHVISWLDQMELPIYLVRYEELHAEPETQFAEILRRAGLPVASDRLAAALAQTRFERLQAQEAAVGFKERLSAASRFFRQGRPDRWREELTPAQIECIERDHAPVMQRLGYL